MPPKTRFSNEDIISAAFSVLRKKGFDAVSARSIAKVLDSSTTPIYTYLKSMKNLESALVQKSLDLLLFFQQKKVDTGDPLLDNGVGYVLFAMQEKHLFRFLHDEKRLALYLNLGESMWEAGITLLSENPLSKKLTNEQKRIVMFTQFVFAHGLADLLNNAFHRHVEGLKGEKEISDYMAESLKIHWEGIRKHFQLG